MTPDAKPDPVTREASTAVAVAAAALARAGNSTGLAEGSSLAALVAGQIVADIAAHGWPEGTVVGSEAELLERHEVGRAVLREAVRLLEHLHVARMRRGPGGGLVVLPPSVDAVTDAVAVYLVYMGAEIEEVMAARLVLEEIAAELAPVRLESQHVTALRDLVSRERAGRGGNHRDLHNLIAAMTGNPALAFLVDLLNRVTRLYLPVEASLPRQALDESVVAHGAIAAAILRGDAGLARIRMRKHLVAEAEVLRAHGPSRQRLAAQPGMVGRSGKRAEQVAGRIFGEVARDGWPVGALLGSEAQLMARHGVSRAVLREAVRVLEHHQVARMRRGPGGGLFVTGPGVEAVTEAVALQLNRLGIGSGHLFEVRGAVEMSVLDLVLARMDGSAVQRLEQALDAERAPARADRLPLGDGFHATLAAIAGNRVSELLVLVLLRLTRGHRVVLNAGNPLPVHEGTGTHLGVVEALAAGDRELARRRMRRHLDGLAGRGG